MKPRRIDWYPVDWLDGVATMPPAQRGVYDTIINLIYAHAAEDGSIELDERELAVRCCCHWRELRSLLATLVRGGKVAQDGRRIWITRCAEELQKARTRAARAQQNGGISAKNNHMKSGLGSHDAEPHGRNNHQPSTINQEEVKPILSDGQKASDVAHGRVAKRRQQVPADWLPDDAGCGYARQEAGWPEARIEREVSRFRDYHRSKGNLFLDTPAAWRTWVRNGAERDPARGATRPSDAAPDQEPDEADQWRARLTVWLDPERVPTADRWASAIWGAPPGREGCCVPPAILAEFGLTPQAIPA